MLADKDDLNIIFNRDQQGKPAFVDMQINMEPTPRLRYCDNTAGTTCDKRRVVTAKISYDGKAWGRDLGLRSPDELDPPVRLPCSCDRRSARVLTRERAVQELQFYRFRPFMIGDSGRLAGHALQYAPGPWLGDEYGRQPTHCVAPTNDSCWTTECGHCHGPCDSTTVLSPDLRLLMIACEAQAHVRGALAGPELRHGVEHEWVAAALPPPSLRQARCIPHVQPRHDRSGERQLRSVVASSSLSTSWPLVSMGTAVVCLQEHLWLSAGQVWSLPLYRLAGLYAPANGEMSTAPFAWPAGGVTVNAALKWRGRTVTGGCDEGCAGYLFFELLDHVRPTPPLALLFLFGPRYFTVWVPEDSTN